MLPAWVVFESKQGSVAIFTRRISHIITVKAGGENVFPAAYYSSSE
jgi:hypothetical protein